MNTVAKKKVRKTSGSDKRRTKSKSGSGPGAEQPKAVPVKTATPVSEPEVIAASSFADFGLNASLVQQLETVGYETPSPIQAQSIPVLLKGEDLIGQAQTGTGKTAAFALPALQQIDLTAQQPQILVLTPTRELAIQVAEAFQTYATQMRKFSVLPIFGGQDIRAQVRALQRNPQVLVSTPGRLMDHMRRGNLSLEHLAMLVLDEADEMLRMGFIEDVEWILDKTPSTRQIALFSATMPTRIKQIAKKYLNNPVSVEIEKSAKTASTIRQRYWPVQGVHKLDALTRMLEAEDADGVIIFVRTKTSSAEIADKLSARGYRASALNGEMPQALREKTVERMRSGKLDLLVATDVAARGLDVQRVSHVINYDIPYDTESYIHRIGRTGRAGRQGEAILFVMPRERRMLATIERVIGNKIEQMKLPNAADINEKRALKLTRDISQTLATVDLASQKAVIEQYLGEHEFRGSDVAAALVHMLQSSTGKSIDLTEDSTREKRERRASSDRPGRSDRPVREKRAKRQSEMPALEDEMERFRLEVGHTDEVMPANIVGAIANEAGIDSQYIGRIAIRDDYSLIDLPEGMPKAIFKDLRQTRVCGKPLLISRVDPDVGDGEGQKQQHTTRKNKKSDRAQSSSVKQNPKSRKNSGTKRSKKSAKKKRRVS